MRIRLALRRSSVSRRAPSLSLGGTLLLAPLLVLLALSSLLASSGSARVVPMLDPLRVANPAVVNVPQVSAGCGKKSPIAPGITTSGEIISSGDYRTYLLHLPTGYLPKHHYPLVLNFHGHSNTDTHQEQMTGFSTLADRLGFIMAYPQGIIGPDLHTGWASGGPNKPRINDVLFVSDLLNALQETYCIDPARIYATGFSNGGGMTSVLACRLSDRIAAFASVSGSYFVPEGGCHPDRAIPFLEFHGTDDGTVPYDGNRSTHLIGAAQWAQSWATRDGCTAEQIDVLADGVTKYAWSDCLGGAEVIHYRIARGQHVWPGSLFLNPHLAPGDLSVDATTLIWSFFAAHPLPMIRGVLA